MSDANRTAMRAVKETSFRVLPNNPYYQELRFNSESLTYNPTTEISNELESTRQVKDLILTGFDVMGDIATEYSLENLDMMLEGGLCNPWLRQPEVYNGPAWEYNSGNTARISGISFSGGAATVTTAATIIMAGSSIAQPTTVYLPGNLIRNSGFGVVANNGVFPVTTSTATTVVFTGGATEAAPPVGARMKAAGFQAASGDVAATTIGGNALTSTTLNFTTLGLLVGQYVKVSAEGGNYSFATAGCNSYCRVSAIAANRLSFDIVVGGAFAGDTGAGKTIRLYYGDTIRNGIQEYSYRLEKQYELDAGTRYIYYRGCEVNTIAFNGDTRALMTATLTFMGSDSTGFNAVRDTGAVTVPGTTGTVLDSSNSVPWLLEAGALVANPNYVSSFTFQLENNLRAQNAVGSPGAIGIGQGRSSLSGNLNTYFGDETILNKLISNTASSCAFSFRDAASGKAEIWDIPRLKYSSGVPETTGVDTDIFSNLAFQGLRDVLNNRDYTVMLSRFDYTA